MFGFIDTTKELNTNGIGLGLNISKEIVKKFGGFIQCDSQWQRGSTFTFMFVLNPVLNQTITNPRCKNPIVKVYERLVFKPNLNQNQN